MKSEQDIKLWRREQRARLIAARLTASPPMRRQWDAAIEARLAALIATLSGSVLGIYWPVRAEFDPRPLAERLRARGWAIALPAVVDRRGPLEYRLWQPGMAMASGAYDIPVPEARQVAQPDIVLAPLVGFDVQNYRLGYGGGYFDRTLAALAPRPVAIGIGCETALLASIFPAAHDVPMDFIVTEAQLRRRAAPPAQD
jgi:5-formyltetrahydrofolate cyclo-ligase